MKKYYCLVCKSVITEHDTYCSNCHTEINRKIIFEKNNLESLKHNIKMYIISKEYKRCLNLLIDTNNQLVLEYYKMFCSKMLSNAYDETNFFDKKLEYTNEELDEIILHMIEHHTLFDINKIKTLASLSENNEKLVKILNKIETNEEMLGKDRELRENLFKRTIVPELKPVNSYYKEAKSYLYLSIVLYVILYLLVIILVNKDIKYQFMNISFILPTILLSKSLTRYILKKKNILFSILIFVITYYLTTLIGSLIWNEINFNIFINHFKAIINTPKHLIAILIERLKE